MESEIIGHGQQMPARQIPFGKGSEHGLRFVPEANRVTGHTRW
jgi:hypothetical protein